MKFRLATVALSALALAACGSADDASTESDAETVEPAANAALEDVADESVEDADASLPEPASTEPTATEIQQIEEAGDNAAATSEEVADLLLDE